MTNETPQLSIGTTISGATVIAAIREPDRDGYLPGLHVVTAYSEARAEYVTWQVARQGDRWVANAGHYFPVPDRGLTGGDVADDAVRRDALADMVKRA